MLKNRRAKIQQLWVVLFVVLGLAGCAGTETSEVGAEPTLGVAVTAFRDEPIVTSDLDVLGTVQVSELDEVAIGATEESPAQEASRRTLIWGGVIALVLLSFGMTGAARVTEARAKN